MENTNEQQETTPQKKNEPLINIVVRTHRRPGYFASCMESIRNQVYENKKVWVLADDAFSWNYTVEQKKQGGINHLIRITPGDVQNDFVPTSVLKKQGFEIGRRDVRRCPYNLYLNVAMQEIDDGYVFFVDDDKTLTDPMLLNRMAKKLRAKNKLLIGKYAMKDRTVPNTEHWRKVPFVRGQIDMSCAVFHIEHRELARQDGHKAGDWRMCNRLLEKLKPVWMNEVFVVADNNGNFGKEEKENHVEERRTT